MSIQPGPGYTFSSSSLGTALNIQHPWSPIPLYYTPEEETCPFTIVDASVGETYKFSCTPGTVNSIIPQIGIAIDPAKRLDKKPTPTTAFNFSPEGYSYIYLKVSALYTSLPTEYPVADENDILYPRIISTSIQQTATDDSAFFLLAVAFQDPDATPPKPITITQLTCGSQWTDRIKVGTTTAKYFFARA